MNRSEWALSEQGVPEMASAKLGSGVPFGRLESAPPMPAGSFEELLADGLLQASDFTELRAEELNEAEAGDWNKPEFKGVVFHPSIVETKKAADLASVANDEEDGSRRVKDRPADQGAKVVLSGQERKIITGCAGIRLVCLCHCFAKSCLSQA